MVITILVKKYQQRETNVVQFHSTPECEWFVGSSQVVHAIVVGPSGSGITVLSVTPTRLPVGRNADYFYPQPPTSPPTSHDLHTSIYFWGVLERVHIRHSVVYVTRLHQCLTHIGNVKIVQNARGSWRRTNLMDIYHKCLIN